MNLTELANLYKSDKGTITGNPPHKYTYLYDLIFYPFRNCPLNLLEMGLAVGGPEVGGPIERRVNSPSIQMWTEYFPLATVYGFDISDFSHIQHSNFRFLQGDSGSAADIERLAGCASHFDIIIDDGSHASYHQQAALRQLWTKLASGGLYVIEDLQWQSPAFESILPKVPKTAIIMNSFFEEHTYVPSDVLDEAFLMSVRQALHSYAAFPAFKGLQSSTKLIVMRKA